MELTILGWHAVAPDDGRYRVIGQALIWLDILERVEVSMAMLTSKVAMSLK